MKQFILPKKIIRAKNVDNSNGLKIEKPFQPVLRGDPDWLSAQAIVNGKGYLILDFGKEMCGGIKITTGTLTRQDGVKSSTAKIRIRFGESLSETCTDIMLGGATNDHSPRDFEALVSNYGCVSYGNTGFRFVRLDFIDDAKIVLQSIYCENEILNKKAIYRYKGDDKLVRKIFDTAKRTVDLCASSGYVWDGVKRDRLVWIGDMHPETLSLVTLYGKIDCVTRSLEFIREQTPVSLWMNGISSYSMWWMIIVSDYYLLTGDKAFIERQIEYLKGLIEKFDTCVEEDGKMNYGWLFVDWPTCGNNNDSEAGVRAINVFALNKVISTFKDLGLDTALAEKVLKKLKKQPIKVEKMKQVIALKYMAEGSVSDEEYQPL